MYLGLLNQKLQAPGIKAGDKGTQLFGKGGFGIISPRFGFAGLA
jgi:hypothetical protein